MVRRLGTGGLAVFGLTLLAAALPVGVALAAPATSHRWADLIDHNALLVKRSIPVLLIDAGSAVKPVVLIVGLVVLAWCWRASRRASLVLCSVVLGANLTIQLVKHPLMGHVPELWGLNPLSGHVGLVGAVCLGWLVVAPRSAKLASALTAVVALCGVAGGVVLAGWHTPAQVVCCLMICAGWALVGAYVMTLDSVAFPRRCWSTALWLTVLANGAAACTLAFVSAQAIDVLGAGSFVSAALLGVVAATGAGAATVGTLMALAGHVGMSRVHVESEPGHADQPVEAAYR